MQPASTLQRSPRSANGAFSLAREYYCDEGIFAEEFEKIFSSAWWITGRDVDWPEARHFRTFTLAGQPIVVIRDEQYRLRAFHNVCRHRGAKLIGEPGGCLEKGVVMCPYHAWTYQFEGSLVGAPNMADVPNFDRSSWGLHPVSLVEQDGFVMANLSGTALVLPQDLGELFLGLKNWELSRLRQVASLRYEVGANWKLLFQNYSECYHCPAVHPALNRLTPYTHAENLVTEGGCLGGPMPLAPIAITMSLDGQQVAKMLPRLDADQKRQVHYYTVFPSFFISLHPDYVMVHRLNPLRVDATEVICEFFCDPTSTENPHLDFGAAVDFWDLTNRQDWEVCERVQQGANSKVFQPGPYSNFESTVAAFDRHYRKVIGR